MLSASALIVLNMEVSRACGTKGVDTAIALFDDDNSVRSKKLV
jgi:hypothetical protein